MKLRKSGVWADVYKGHSGFWTYCIYVADEHGVHCSGAQGTFTYQIMAIMYAREQVGKIRYAKGMIGFDGK